MRTGAAQKCTYHVTVEHGTHKIVRGEGKQGVGGVITMQVLLLIAVVWLIFNVHLVNAVRYLFHFLIHRMTLQIIY
jgi:hypothetical protein